LLGASLTALEIIADNLSKAGWSWGCFSAVDSRGRTIFIADAHCGDDRCFVVRADDKLTAFVKPESATGFLWQERVCHGRSRAGILIAYSLVAVTHGSCWQNGRD
jgi:hypothetical protein